MKRRNVKHGGSVSSGASEINSFDPAAVARARRSFPADAVMMKMADGFGALAHPARLRLLLALDGRELCVCDCSQVLGASISGTSQHLKELRRLGAITFRAEGKMAYYRLADRRWLHIAEAAITAITVPVDDMDSA